MQQKTLRAPCHIQGVGLHSGGEARLTLLPAPADTGIVFKLNGNGPRVDIPARREFVTRTQLSTTLGRDGVEIWTVEHLMAALAGLEIDNVVIQMEGREVPAMDGSAQPFVSRIMEVGRKLLPTSRRYLKVLAPIVVEDRERVAGLYPATDTTFAFLIEFDHPLIQTQSLKVRLTPQTFVSQLAKARTFGFVDEVKDLQGRGLARGAGLENAVGLGGDGTVLNPEGLRYRDEFVRHKLLDAVGDLFLAGYPILGEYRGIRSGHQLNVRLLNALAQQTDSWELITAGVQEAALAV
jgi:UDP-3-O-[3-hydroxymyristoyl] N-acetylglucosamine deacetylase